MKGLLKFSNRLNLSARPLRDMRQANGLSVLFRLLLVGTACFALLVSFVSCEKHESGVDYSLRVGNIYCQDGRIIPPVVYNAEKDVPIGVVVFLGNPVEEGDSKFKAIAVGLDEWKTSIATQNVLFSDVRSGVDDMQGRANTAAMMLIAQEDSMISFPAAEYASRFESGDGSWYIPACGELRHLSSVKRIISPVLEQVKGTPLTDQWYVSSSQDDTSEATQELYMLNVSMAEGRVMSSEKTAVKTVRPFIVIR